MTLEISAPVGEIIPTVERFNRPKYDGENEYAATILLADVFPGVPRGTTGATVKRTGIEYRACRMTDNGPAILLKRRSDQVITVSWAQGGVKPQVDQDTLRAWFTGALKVTYKASNSADNALQLAARQFENRGIDPGEDRALATAVTLFVSDTLSNGTVGWGKADLGTKLGEAKALTQKTVSQLAADVKRDRAEALKAKNKEKTETQKPKATPAEKLADAVSAWVASLDTAFPEGDERATALGALSSLAHAYSELDELATSELANALSA